VEHGSEIAELTCGASN